jgi:hypothetical protein
VDSGSQILKNAQIYRLCCGAHDQAIVAELDRTREPTVILPGGQRERMN